MPPYMGDVCIRWGGGEFKHMAVGTLISAFNNAVPSSPLHVPWQMSLNRLVSKTKSHSGAGVFVVVGRPGIPLAAPLAATLGSATWCNSDPPYSYCSKEWNFHVASRNKCWVLTTTTTTTKWTYIHITKRKAKSEFAGWGWGSGETASWILCVLNCTILICVSYTRYYH